MSRTRSFGEERDVERLALYCCVLTGPCRCYRVTNVESITVSEKVAEWGFTPPLPKDFFMSDGTPAPSSIDSGDLAQAIDRLEKNIDAINSTQKTARFVVLGGSLLLICMLAIFGFRLFQTLKTQLNEETLQAALTAKAEAIWPQLSEKLTAAAMSAVPAYRDEALKRMQTLQPKLQKILTDEATAIADRLPTVLQEKAATSLDRVTQQVADDVKNEIPGLTPERVKSMSQQLVEGLALESEKLQKMLGDISQKETDRIELMLKKLPVAEAAKESEDRLQQRFMHHILLLVDRAVAPDESVLRTDAPFALDAPAATTN